MKTTHFLAALLASTALAACGGGDETADTAETETNAAADTAATETSADAMGDDAGMDAEAPMEEPQEAPMDAEEAAADDASGDMSGDDMSSDDMSGDAAAGDDAAAGGDGQFMVAGLTGDPEQGRRVFARCRSCHVLDEGVNRVGPSLYGIFGRETGSVEGFRYSDANANAGITWTHETMFEYLENPREYIPGTIMAFPGLRDEQDRADVVAYISANGGEG
ncbi:MAG: cytochrome c family protein [Oceanicaulis sp.]